MKPTRDGSITVGDEQETTGIQPCNKWQAAIAAYRKFGRADRHCGSCLYAIDGYRPRPPWPACPDGYGTQAPRD